MAMIQLHLVGGFNPFEKYESNCIISPGRDENKRYLKPPPSHIGFQVYQDISGINSSVPAVVCFFFSPAVELSGFFMTIVHLSSGNDTLI